MLEELVLVVDEHLAGGRPPVAAAAVTRPAWLAGHPDDVEVQVDRAQHVAVPGRRRGDVDVEVAPDAGRVEGRDPVTRSRGTRVTASTSES